MAVISIRLNAEEEKIITFLSDQYEKDKSSLIKYSLKEMYEDFLDHTVIDEFERNEKALPLKYLSTEEILNQIQESDF